MTKWRQAYKQEPSCELEPRPKGEHKVSIFHRLRDHAGQIIFLVIIQVVNFKRDEIFSFFCLQVPGGRLAEMFGTKRVFGINM